MPQTAGGLLTLTGIYDALRARGYEQKENNCVVIEDIPVQFLPAYNSLVEEALAQAREMMYEDACSGFAQRILGRNCPPNRAQQGSRTRADFARTGAARFASLAPQSESKRPPEPNSHGYPRFGVRIIYVREHGR